MGMVLVGIGALALVAGVLMLIQRLRTMTVGRSAQGRVVGHAKSTATSDRDGSTEFVTLHAPIVEFSHDGRPVRFTSSLAQEARLGEGATVPVRYLASDPAATAEIATPMRMWGYPVVALVAGAAFVLMGLTLGRPGGGQG